MAFLAAAAPYIAAGTTVLTAAQQVQAGQHQQAQADVLAASRERDANQAQVEAQREAAIERRRAKLVRSRALAVAGASGAGVSDPGVSSILSDIETEGEMNALTALASGDYLARGLRSGADTARREGSARETAGYLSGASTALSGAVSWWDKYGEGTT
jgi:hypothetical protein